MLDLLAAGLALLVQVLGIDADFVKQMQSALKTIPPLPRTQSGKAETLLTAGDNTAGKDVLAGVIDVATDRVETPEEVADTIEQILSFVPPERLFPCTNCGMAPMRREIAEAKLAALGAGAALARKRFAS